VIEQYKLKQYDIENFEAILADINADMSFNNLILGEDGQEKESMVEINMMISLIMGMIIYMFVAMFGNMVMTSVINEKSNKIVEVIVSSVKPFDLMMGKIIGVAAVALTQFLIWIILTLGILMGISAYAGMEMFADPQMAQQMEMMAPMGAEQMEMMTSQGAMSEVLGVITSVDWGYIIGCFLIYFILGYLLYASLFAAVGSAVENESDTNQLMIPITIPLIIGLLLMMQTFNNPDSTVSFWASMIPFTSPMVMLARVPFEGGVPTWELLLSIGILLLTIIVVVYLAAKIYRVGILMTGKKYSWKDIWTWIKY
jgi:ABC-2 type transport system permease protein